MRSPGISGEGDLRGQPANPGSPGENGRWNGVCVLTTITHLLHDVLSHKWVAGDSHTWFTITYHQSLYNYLFSVFKWPFSTWTWVTVLLVLSMMEVVMTAGAIRRAKLQWNGITIKPTPNFFTGLMPFLSSNQQCQSSLITTVCVNCILGNIELEFKKLIGQTLYDDGSWWKKTERVIQGRLSWTVSRMWRLWRLVPGKSRVNCLTRLCLEKWLVKTMYMCVCVHVCMKNSS